VWLACDPCGWGTITEPAHHTAEMPTAQRVYERITQLRAATR
jgi:hypothetical protein